MRTSDNSRIMFSNLAFALLFTITGNAKANPNSNLDWFKVSCLKVVEQLRSPASNETENMPNEILEAYFFGFVDSFRDIGGKTSLKELERYCVEHQKLDIQQAIVGLSSDKINDIVHEAVQDALDGY